MFFLLLLVNPIDNIMFHLIETKSSCFLPSCFMYVCFIQVGCSIHCSNNTLSPCKRVCSQISIPWIFHIHIFLLLSIRSISSLCRICIQPINYFDRHSSDSIAQKIKLMLHVVLSCPEKMFINCYIYKIFLGSTDHHHHILEDYSKFDTIDSLQDGHAWEHER